MVLFVAWVEATIEQTLLTILEILFAQRSKETLSTIKY